MTAPTDQFSVSVSDLAGFATQVDHLGDVYDTLHDGLFKSFVDIDIKSVINMPGEASGPLSGALSSFQDDFLALMDAETRACERIGNGLHNMAGGLTATAADYAHRDREAEEALRSADPNSPEADRAEEIADAIDTVGKPRSDWQGRVTTVAPEAFDPTDAAYCAAPMTYVDAMSGVEGLWGQAAAGSVFGMLDSMVQELTGISVIKEMIKPFTGNWGFLWYMSDVLAGAVDVLAEISAILRHGVRTLIELEWTGSAAEAFGEHALIWIRVIDAHAGTLNRAATLLGDMGDEMDDAGSKIAPMLEALADIMLSAIVSLLERNPLAVVGTLGGFLFDLWNQDGKPVKDAIEGITTIVDTSATSTEDLVAEVDEL